jgi:hypothetical protein
LSSPREDAGYGDVGEIIAARDDVIPRNQSVFAPQRLTELTADEFRSFLHFKNNRHWAFLVSV